MAVQRDRIAVTPPPGETVTVDILDTGVSVGTAYADRTKSRTYTLPLEITEKTSFFLPAGGGPYQVSVKLNDVEIAGPAGTTVTASSFPTEVTATLDVAELGLLEGGGSSAAPSSPVVNQLWYDSNAELWKRWNGSAWVAEGSAAYLARRLPSTPGAFHSALAQVPRELFGIDDVANAGYYISGTNIYRYANLSAGIGTEAPLSSALSLPPGVTDGTTLHLIYRWKNKLYVAAQVAADGLTKVFRCDPTTGNTDFTWEGPLLTFQSGGLSYYTTISGDDSYLYVAEYGDPVNASVPNPKIYRSSDGSTWSAADTRANVRHCHAVAADPYNPGHVWATWGDGNGVSVTRSTDYGATWTTTLTDSAWQAVQISFSPKWVWFAADNDYTTVYVIDRSTNTPYHAATNFHANIAVPGAFGRKAGTAFTDAATTNASTTLTSATASFASTDVGRRVIGAGIPTGTYISAFTNATTVTLSAAATATASGVTIQLGGDAFYSKAWFGAVDPATETYYCISNSSTTGGNRIGLFYLPSVGQAIQVLDVYDIAAIQEKVYLYGGYVLCSKNRHKQMAMVASPY